MPLSATADRATVHYPAGATTFAVNCVVCTSTSKMPDFMHLDDATLAAVLHFVVFDLGHLTEDTKPLTAEEIAAARGHPVDGVAVREHR